MPSATDSLETIPPHMTPLYALTNLEQELADQAAAITAEINLITSILPPEIAASSEVLLPSSGQDKSPHQHLLDIEITIQSAHLTLQRLSAATKSLRKSLGRDVLHQAVPAPPAPPGLPSRRSRAGAAPALKDMAGRNPCTEVWGRSRFLEPIAELEAEGSGFRYPSPPPQAGERKRQLGHLGVDSEDEVLDCKLIVLKKRRTEVE